MKKAFESISLAVGAIIVGIVSFCAAYIYAVLVGGIILLHFYNWFILPAFDWLPKISFYEALGIALFIKTVFSAGTGKYVYYEFKGEQVKSKIKWTPLLLFPWITLLLGYFTHLFIR